MKEEFLHYIWKYKLFNNNLLSQNQEKIGCQQGYDQNGFGLGPVHGYSPLVF